MARFALQAELYGLTQTQRTNGKDAVETQFDLERIIGVYVVDDNKTIHGSVALFVEADFDTGLEGQRIHEIARSWASTRAEDAADGRHSYVWLRDSVPPQMHMLLAESPDWVTVETTEEARK